jgi:hypothetical protein
MAKLTLNADPEVIKLAKHLATEANTSVSALFSRLIVALAKNPKSGIPLGPLTRKASGTIALGTDQDYRDVLSDSLTDKYGLS